MIQNRWHPVFIGVGSNLDQPIVQVTKAMEELSSIADVSHVIGSPLYFSDPLGPADQPDYVNAVVGLLTRLEPLQLLTTLQDIEQGHNRKRDGERWGARTLDLDILAYAQEVIDEENLIVPHRELHKRNFVLGPWRDIAPEYGVPGLGTVARLADHVNIDALRRIELETGE